MADSVRRSSFDSRSIPTDGASRRDDFGRSLVIARRNAMNEVVREFLLETHENLAQLDLDLVTLEKEPAERETVASVFRTLHTVKGTAGFLGLPKLQAVAHAAENLL